MTGVLATGLAESASAQAALPDSTASAPRRRFAPWRLGGGLSLAVSQPLGDFARTAAWGVGVSGAGTVHADQRQRLGLRVDGGYQNHGRQATPFGVGAIGGAGGLARMQTSNDVFWFSVGPQLSVPIGPVRPYAFAGLGVANFATTSTVDGGPWGAGAGAGTALPVMRAAVASDWSWARQLGGGMRVRLREREATNVALDLGARWQQTGAVRHFGAGLLPLGGPTLTPVRGEARFLTYHLGMTIGRR